MCEQVSFLSGWKLSFANCRVNKPYLPIAAGDLSVQSAWFLVLAFAVTGLLTVGVNFGPFIMSLYCLGLFLGTIYSVPPFRLKRFPVFAFLIIATVSFSPLFLCNNKMLNLLFCCQLGEAIWFHEKDENPIGLRGKSLFTWE